ncbi:FadR/GntR family transcriptional regulator [Nocardioides kongjuensis]|uniref:DNA-binding FadR family transcriptional regulator n=1 Tax=Nocardioides kongjuensis TaxID=349522 RepID=A0A852RVQ9_9ACTN|nr:DNA-binding FadR family transcriptional regulator [Nocardioides kongjuensis]
MSGLTPLISPSAVGGRADEVVQRISEAIHLGLLGDGERLPSEVELAAQFGVAPMTMRDALAALRAEGLVETKRGRSGGSFVRRPSSPPVGPVRQRLVAMTISGLRDLVDEHQGVAGQAARLAAERASASNARRLFALTEQLGSAMTPGDRVRADCRFHIEVAVASQSSRLTRREVGLQAEVSGMLWLLPEAGVDVTAHVEEHHAIAAAVLAEDGAEARRLAEQHVAGVLRLLTAAHLRLIDEGTEA